MRKRTATRRQFVGAALATAGAITWPGPWTRRGWAQTRPDAPVKHLILMYAGGGLRSSAAFHAATHRQFNPYGVSPGSRGWRVGAIFDDARVPIPSLGRTIPSLAELSDTYSVLGSVDHTPGAPRGDGGHGTGYLRMGTGDPTGGVGLHTIINWEIGLDRGIPAFIVGETAWVFGAAPGRWRIAEPKVLSGRDFFERTGHSEIRASPLAREIFADDELWGPRVALAAKLIERGSPAVAVGVPGYDTHEGEQATFERLMRSYGRALQGLHFALTNSLHPLGGTFWDHTMVLGVSEFGRDNTSPRTGFNRTGGSDHRGTNACRYQTFPVGGGAIRPGTVVGDVDPDSWEPTRGQVFSSRQVLNTVLWAFGIDGARYGFGDDSAITELFSRT